MACRLTRTQAIMWTNAWILLIGPLEKYFNEISIRLQQFLFIKMSLKVSSAKCLPFCVSLNVSRNHHPWLKAFAINFLVKYNNPAAVVVVCTKICGIITGLILGLCPANWETLLQSKAVSHWLGANLLSYDSQVQNYSKMICYQIWTGHVTWWLLLGLLSWYPLILVTSLQLIWRLGTHRWNLRVPNLQMGCSDLT